MAGNLGGEKGGGGGGMAKGPVTPPGNWRIGTGAGDGLLTRWLPVICSGHSHYSWHCGSYII